MTDKDNRDPLADFRFNNALSVHTRTGEVRKGGKLIGTCDGEGNMEPINKDKRPGDR